MITKESFGKDRYGLPHTSHSIRVETETKQKKSESTTWVLKLKCTFKAINQKLLKIMPYGKKHWEMILIAILNTPALFHLASMWIDIYIIRVPHYGHRYKMVPKLCVCVVHCSMRLTQMQTQFSVKRPYEWLFEWKLNGWPKFKYEVIECI